MVAKLSLRFTNTESFMLFAEGLRSLQLYQDDDRVSDLADAAQNLEKCVRRYPDDAMPLYYLGVVRSLQGQDEQERQQRRWQAISIFEEVAKCGPRSLRAHAEFSRDALQAQMKTEFTVKPAREVRALVGARAKLKNFGLQAFARFVPGFYAVDLTPTATHENQAIQLQRKALADYLKVQELAKRRDIRGDSDELQRMEKSLASFKAELDATEIPELARQDMMADYWNMLGLLKETQEDPRNAEPCYRRALAIKPGWLPAKRNLANALAAQKKTSEATALRDQIRAVEHPPAPPSPAEKPNADAIVDFILKSAPADNANAIAQSIKRAWGPLDQPALQELLSALAGRIEPALLSQILTQL